MNHRVLLLAMFSLICAATFAYGLLRDEMLWPRGTLRTAEHEDDDPTAFWFLALIWFGLSMALAYAAILSWGTPD